MRRSVHLATPFLGELWVSVYRVTSNEPATKLMVQLEKLVWASEESKLNKTENYIKKGALVEEECRTYTRLTWGRLYAPTLLDMLPTLP